MRNELNNEYFDWLLKLVGSKPKYRRLMTQLFHTDFYSILDMDQNRTDDGINLRYCFGREKGYEEKDIYRLLDDRPCSILEMMVALANRCEEQIMWDANLGDRTDIWFWSMIRSLGLSDMVNFKYDQDHVDDILRRFLDRKYEKNGSGGLFTISNPNRDMRVHEIWYQLSLYIRDIM